MASFQCAGELLSGTLKAVWSQFFMDMVCEHKKFYDEEVVALKRMIRSLMKEDGAYTMIEAVFIYPIVFLILFLLVFMGLYVLHLSTLSAYAQKVAIITSREISCPGYHKLLNDSRYSSTAVEADFETDATGETPFSGKINIKNKVSESENRVYRYWFDPLSESEKKYYEGVLSKLVKDSSIINGDAFPVNVDIETKNYIIAQFVTVSIQQQIMDIEILDIFGVESPTVSVSAVATVSDTDELVRNTDFAVDAVEVIAEKIGVDTRKIKETVMSGLKKLGLIQS